MQVYGDSTRYRNTLVSRESWLSHLRHRSSPRRAVSCCNSDYRIRMWMQRRGDPAPAGDLPASPTAPDPLPRAWTRLSPMSMIHSLLQRSCLINEAKVPTAYRSKAVDESIVFRSRTSLRLTTSVSEPDYPWPPVNHSAGGPLCSSLGTCLSRCFEQGARDDCTPLLLSCHAAAMLQERSHDLHCSHVALYAWTDCGQATCDNMLRLALSGWRVLCPQAEQDSRRHGNHRASKKFIVVMQPLRQELRNSFVRLTLNKRDYQRRSLGQRTAVLARVQIETLRSALLVEPCTQHFCATSRPLALHQHQSFLPHLKNNRTCPPLRRLLTC